MIISVHEHESFYIWSVQSVLCCRCGEPVMRMLDDLLLEREFPIMSVPEKEAWRGRWDSTVGRWNPDCCHYGSRVSRWGQGTVNKRSFLSKSRMTPWSWLGRIKQDYTHAWLRCSLQMLACAVYDLARRLPNHCYWNRYWHWLVADLHTFWDASRGCVYAVGPTRALSQIWTVISRLSSSLSQISVTHKQGWTSYFREFWDRLVDFSVLASTSVLSSTLVAVYREVQCVQEARHWRVLVLLLYVNMCWRALA